MNRSKSFLIVMTCHELRVFECIPWQYQICGCVLLLYHGIFSNYSGVHYHSTVFDYGTLVYIKIPWYCHSTVTRLVRVSMETLRVGSW